MDKLPDPQAVHAFAISLHHPGGSQLLLRSLDERGVDYLLDAFIVDLLLNANGQSFDTLSRYAQTMDLDGITVKTVSLEGLLLTKRTI